MREVKIEGVCPYCGQPDLVMRSLPLEIPFFGDALQTTLLCLHCTFRHADVLLMKEGPPVRYEMRVDTPRDLWARVVRSSNGTIRIPELGATIEPRQRGESFVTNAEGVLSKVRDIIEFVRRNADSATSRRRAEQALARIESMVAGREPFTLIVEDPTGNSAILHEKATKAILPEAEARRLKRGPSFDLSR